MCLALYLFTDTELPTSKWDEKNPKVHVETVCDGEDRNAKKWPHDQRYVYYIGSYQGCGCGWSPSSEWDEPADIAAKKRDRLDLARLLDAIDHDRSWFVVCWEGDQGEAMHPVQPISLDQIVDPKFEFIELQQYRVAQY